MIRDLFTEIEIKCGDEFLYLFWNAVAGEEFYEFSLQRYEDEEVVEIELSMEMIEAIHKAAKKLSSQ